MLRFKIIGLLMLIAGSSGAPLASVHVKFISPPHIYEHQLTTDGHSTLAQKSFLSIGRRSADFGNKLPGFFKSTPSFAKNPEALWPNGVFFADINDLGVNSQATPDFSNGLAYPDPLLLTDESAVSAIRHLYSRTGLYFHEIPHMRLLVRLQQERRSNGLHDNLLSSIRPQSPFYNHSL